jgi:hypothetical protein
MATLLINDLRAGLDSRLSPVLGKFKELRAREGETGANINSSWTDSHAA